MKIIECISKIYLTRYREDYRIEGSSRVRTHRIKRDCYADTKNISDSENWQLQIGNGFDVSRCRTARGLVTGFSRLYRRRRRLARDLRLGSRDNFARVFRRVFLETRTNRVSPIISRVREIGSSRIARSLARSVRARREFSNYSGLQFRSAAAKTPRGTRRNRVNKQAYNSGGYTLYLPSRSLVRGEEVGNRYYLETCSDIIRDFASRSFFFCVLM